MRTPWVFLPSSAVVGFEATDASGEFEVVAELDRDQLEEGDGAKIAAARELFQAAQNALVVIHELRRNHIGGLQDEYHDMVDAIRAAIAQAEDRR